ncbi:MAG TPA: pilus assembly protein N-terminal domain-containing protein [Microvirga sp.]|jgi:Flp pilus assembly secretin CpaC|nr:pilus assembly protein N-terminal domain-containing protein [Microvirga sp.]
MLLVRAAAALLLGLAPLSAGAADLRVAPSAGGAPVVTDLRVAPIPLLALDPGTSEVLLTARPARTVVVGDPGIVEASVANERTILLNAKAAGFTNLILLDEDGNPFYRRTVRVGVPPRPIIVHRGERVQPYLCDPICNLPPERVPQALVQETVAAEAATRAGASPAAPPPAAAPASPAGNPAQP